MLNCSDGHQEWGKGDACVYLYDEIVLALLTSLVKYSQK